MSTSIVKKFVARRYILPLAVLVLVAICGAAWGNSTRQAHAARPGPIDTRPNIVFLLADDLDDKALAYMPKTKALIADQGVTFPNFLLNTAQCCPSRASILRGQYSQNTGVRTNSQGYEGAYPAFIENGNESSTLGTWFQDAGYVTSFMGKYLNGYPSSTSLPQTHVPPGWNDWFAGINGDMYYQYDYDLNVNGVIQHKGSKPADYLTDVLSRRAVALLNKQATSRKPFLMLINPTAPHTPSVPAPRHEGLFTDVTYPQDPSFNEADISDKPSFMSNLPLVDAAQQADINTSFGNRIRSLQSIDEMVESIVNKLAAQNKLDNTIFVIASDNGYHMAEHRLVGDSDNDRETGAEANLGGNGGKNTAYDTDIKVPLYMRGPGIAAGQTLTQLIGNIDIAPTLAEAAGIVTPGFVDGRSWMPLAKGQTTAWRTSYLLHRGLAPRAGGDNPFSGLRTDTQTYVYYPVTGEYELYDNVNDPYQLQNIYQTSSPSLQADLTARLQALETCSGQSCRDIENLPAIN